MLLIWDGCSFLLWNQNSLPISLTSLWILTPFPMSHSGLRALELIRVSQTPSTLMWHIPREMGPLHKHFKITGEIHFSVSLQDNFSFFLRITSCQVSHSQSKSRFLIINLPFLHLPLHLFIVFAHLCSIFPFFKSHSVTGLAKCRNLSQYFHFSFNPNPFYLPVQMKCRYFCIMSFIVWEIKKVRWGFLFSGLSAKKNKENVLMKG